MRALILSDVHEHEHKLADIVGFTDPDLIIDGGDHTVKSMDDLYQEVPRYFIHGNHLSEDIQELANRREAYSKGNLHYLPNGSLTRIESAGENLLVAALGGNYAKNSWNSKSPGYHIAKSHIDKLMRLGQRPDILLTHECSTLLGLKSKKQTTIGLEELDDVVERLSPSLAISGHHHKYKTAKVDDTHLVGLSYPDFCVGLLTKEGSRITYQTLFNTIDYEVEVDYQFLAKQFTDAGESYRNNKTINIK